MQRRDLWRHVRYAGRHTMFMYMEDDTDVTWQALESWAADTEVSLPCTCTTPWPLAHACFHVAAFRP